MKCPRCSYHSFDYLDSCKKCGGDLGEQRGRLGLRGFNFAGRGRPVMHGNLSADSLPTSGFDASVLPFAGSAGPALASDQDRSVGSDREAAEDPAVDNLLAPDFAWGEEAPSLEQPPADPSLPAANILLGDKKSVSVHIPEPESAGGFLASLPVGPKDSGLGFSTPVATCPRPAGRPLSADDLPDASLCVVEAASGAAEATVGIPQSGASPARRMAAGGIDLLILGLACASFVMAGELLFLPATENRWPLESSLLLDLAIPYFLVFFALTFGYFMLFHFLTGQTPGKMFLRLRVEATDGAPLLFSQAFLRSVGGLLSLLAAGIGFLCILSDPEGRGWNDRLAGSRVVPAGCSGEMDDDVMTEPDAVAEGGSFLS